MVDFGLIDQLIVLQMRLRPAHQMSVFASLVEVLKYYLKPYDWRDRFVDFHHVGSQVRATNDNSIASKCPNHVWPFAVSDIVPRKITQKIFNFFSILYLPLECVIRHLLQAVISMYVPVNSIDLANWQRILHLVCVDRVMVQLMMVAPQPLFFDCFVVRAVSCTMDLWKVPNLYRKIVHPNPKSDAKPNDSGKESQRFLVWFIEISSYKWSSPFLKQSVDHVPNWIEMYRKLAKMLNPIMLLKMFPKIQTPPDIVAIIAIYNPKIVTIMDFARLCHCL